MTSEPATYMVIQSLFKHITRSYISFFYHCAESQKIGFSQNTSSNYVSEVILKYVH